MIKIVQQAFLGLSLLIVNLSIFSFQAVGFASEPDPGTQQEMTADSTQLENHATADDHSTSFKPGDFIMDHIADAYDWHITTLGHKHISIPLPVIVYTSEHGLKMFMSSKFHHGHDAYEGFYISHSEEFKGKIVYQNEAGEELRPLDLSITKVVLGLFISMTILLWVFLSVARSYKNRANQAPKGLANWIEPLILFIRDDVARSSIGEKHFERFMPYLLTIFFLIFVNNLLGLIPIFPGGANVTGNIAVTLVFALITFMITSFNGNRNYWAHIFWPPVPHALKPLMIPIEIIGVFIKPFVLMVRLFANITAGHIIVLGFFSLIFIFGGIHAGAGYGVSVITILFTVFMTLLELLVAFIQAYVFTFLSALYFGMAVEEHHH